MRAQWSWLVVAGVALGTPVAQAQDAPIGIVARDVPGEAEAANRAALAHHQARRYGESEAGWAALVSAHPDYDLARFNHACALARLGRLDDARAELVVLLHHDLPSFEERLATDADLEPLRADPALASLRTALRARYLAVASAGHPSVVVGAQTRVCSSAFDRIDATVQAGVFDRQTQRFVPMAPRAHVAGTRATPYALAAAYFDPGASRTMGITALSANADVPRLEHVTLDVWSTELTRLSHTSVPRSPSRLDIAFAVQPPPPTGGPASTTLWAAVCQIDGRGNATDGAVQPSGALGPPGIRCDGGGLSPLLLRDEGWTVVTNAPQGATFRGTQLRFANGITLALPGHGLPEHSVIVSGDYAIVLSMRWLLGESDLPSHHVIDRVHLPTQRIERLSEGAGAASLRAGTDGALYLEAQGVVRRYATIEASSFESLPTWVHLSLPEPNDCGS